MKLKIRVIDIPVTATAEEAERLLNALYDDGYYEERLVQNGLPEGIGARAFFKLRVNRA
jgi:hypothetical protein